MQLAHQTKQESHRDLAEHSQEQKSGNKDLDVQKLHLPNGLVTPIHVQGWPLAKSKVPHPWQIRN